MRFVRTSAHRQQLSLGWLKLQWMLVLAIVLCSVNVPAAGTGTLDQVSGWFPLGTHLTVHAIPGTNSVFTGWLGNTNGATLAGPYITFAVTSSLSVTGVFSTLIPTNQLVKMQNISINGASLSLTVQNGAPNAPWVLLQSTNLLLPLNLWQTNRTGTCDITGHLSTNVIGSFTNPACFYIFK